MSSEQAKPTSLKLIARASDCGDLIIWDENDYPVVSMFGRSGEDEPNAALIIEAFNVLHETGVTPLQLVKQRDELLAALEEVVSAPPDGWLLSDAVSLLERCRKAIASAKGGAA